MDSFELAVGLLALAGAAAALAQRLDVPAPIFLVVAGIGVGYVPGLPALDLDPEVILLVFLPPLIHSAAWLSSPRQLRTHARTVGVLAVGLVAATMAAVAAVAHAVVPGLGWPAAFVLGAALSPTDTVAATATFRRLGAPERLVGVVEGESLINDGSALVLYRIAVAAAVTGVFAAGDALRDLLLVGSGGALFGLAVAVAVRSVRRRLEDPVVEITATLLTPYLAFLPAEQLGLSGILAAVSSGLYLGWRSSRDFSPSTRIQAYGFWAVLVFVLESLLFLLIGLQTPDVLEALEGEPAGRLALSALLVTLAVIGVRLVFGLVAGELERAWDRRRGRDPALSRAERVVLSWAGIRGAVSLAAALAVPLQTDAGAAFPGRDQILFLTLAAIAGTLVLQGLTLPPLVRRLGIVDEGTDARTKALTRFRTVEAALERVAELSFERGVPRSALERARNMYAARAQQLSGECRAGVPVARDSDVAAWTRLRRELLAVERAALIELRDQGAVGIGTVREVERDLDLEEERLSRAVPAGGGGPPGPPPGAGGGGDARAGAGDAVAADR